MKRHAEKNHRFKPQCHDVKTLRQWVDYAEYVSLEFQVDLYTFIFKGHAIFAAHQRVFYNQPARYLHFLLEYPKSINRSDTVDQLSQSQIQEAQQCVENMQSAHTVLEQLVLTSHGGPFGQCESSSGEFGWSPVTQLWHVLCVFRFHVALVRQLIYVAQSSKAHLLRHVRHIPRELSIIEACQQLSHLDPSQSSSNINSILQELCPTELLHSINSLCPTMTYLGCALYPDLPFGCYTQFQVYEQLTFLTQRMYDLDLACADIALLVKSIKLRVCELLHFTYVAPCSWQTALLPCDVTPSKPLDMLPFDRYRLAHRFGGVPPQERPMTVDLNSITQSNSTKSDKPYEYKPDKPSEKDGVSPARAFLDEMLGLLAPITKQLVLVRNLTSNPQCIPPVVMENNVVREQQQLQYLNELTQQCVEQLGHLYPPNSDNKSTHVALEGYASKLTFPLLLIIFNGMLDYRRSRIVDLSYRDDICVHIRRMCLATNLPERYAHLPNNMFQRTYNSEQLENAFLPRPVFQARNEQWRQLELHQLESAPYIPCVARNYVKMCVMRTLGYIRGEEQSWLDRYALFHYQLDQIVDRMNLDESPFVLTIGAHCYVRRDNQFFQCSDARSAMLVWLLFLTMDFPKMHRRDLSECVSTTNWVALLKQLVDNALKDLSQQQGDATEKNQTQPQPPLQSLLPNQNPFEIDLGDSDDDAGEEERTLVQQYMDCDDLL